MRIRVTVIPDARKETFEEVAPTRFVLTVKEPAERNQANKRVITLIARHFKVPEGTVHILTGHRSTKKTISII